MSTAQHFDVVWIGTGQATLTVVPRIVAAGKRVAVVENGLFGGTCINTGCTPTKTLVASARAIHLARRGKDFGFSVDRVDVDFAAVMSTQISNRREARESIECRLRELTDDAVYRGNARFQSDHEVSVDDARLTADTIVVHVGAKPNVPDIAGTDAVPWLTNASILDLDVLPEHLLIIGGSYIALEFGQMFRRFGSRVTILERGPRLLGREDPDISELVASRLADEGIDIRNECQVTRISGESGNITVHFDQDAESTTVGGSHLLFATGRSPNDSTLNLGAAGVDTDSDGYISVNDVMQTSVPHIYAIGDINGCGAFTHTSVNDGEIFWDHYSRSIGSNDESAEWDRKLTTRDVIYAMYIDPPLARVGMNESDARECGRNVLMSTMPMSEIARARETRETYGMVKVFVDADSEQILGATVFGSTGDEVIGAFATIMQSGASYKRFRRVVFPHPTITELMPWTLDDLQPVTDSDD